MRKPIWLLEANVTGLPTEQLRAAIARQGMESRSVKLLPHVGRPGDIAGSENVPHDACVLFMGTLPMMKYLREHRHWRPGAICNTERLACSRYYAWFGEFMLNRRYSLLPVAEVLRNTNGLFQTFGHHGDLFVRPDGVEKSFPGSVVDSDTLAPLLGAIVYDPSTLVLVAEPRVIEREWRLVVCGDEVLTGSQYRAAGEKAVSVECPSDVIQFVHQVLGQVPWRPDPIFIMDVAETREGYRIIELNSFSCSGPYMCSLDPMVEAASRVASIA